MTKKILLSEEECALFQQAVRHVIPLAQANKIPTHLQPKSIRARIRPTTNTESSIAPSLPPLERTTNLAPVGAEEFIQFTQTGVQSKVMRRLRRGEFTIEATLDLHGLNIYQAEQVLQRFLLTAQEKNWRCVQIIHGKGIHAKQEAPLLKNHVNSWLRAYPVVAFCSSSMANGGTGAVYALLKRRPYQ